MTTREIIKSQYRAALAMLGEAITSCPDALWDDQGSKNPFWQIAFHVLFFTHLYLQPNAREFAPWNKHRDGYESLGRRPRPPQREPYTKAQVLEYLALCQSQVEERLSFADLEARSGFDWLPFTKLELQFYNVRHIQHHTGQLADRLRTKEGIGIGWVGAKAGGSSTVIPAWGAGQPSRSQRPKGAPTVTDGGRVFSVVSVHPSPSRWRRRKA